MQYSQCGNVWRNREGVYDSVPRQEVWRRNTEKGLSDKYVMIVQDMYEGARTRAKNNVQLYMGSEEITISGGNEGVKMDEQSYQAGQNKELNN